MKAKRILYMIEGWNHDAVGKTGTISVYSDGVQSVSFDCVNNKWTYKARLSRSDKAPGYSSGMAYGVLDDKDAQVFDTGDQRKMTKIAKAIIAGKK